MGGINSKRTLNISSTPKKNGDINGHASKEANPDGKITMNGDPDNVAVVTDENTSATTNGNLPHDHNPVVKTEVIEKAQTEIISEPEVESADKPDKPEVESAEKPDRPEEESSEKKDEPEVGDSATATAEVGKKKKSSMVDKMKKKISFRSAPSFMKKREPKEVKEAGETPATVEAGHEEKAKDEAKEGGEQTGEAEAEKVVEVEAEVAAAEKVEEEEKAEVKEAEAEAEVVEAVAKLDEEDQKADEKIEKESSTTKKEEEEKKIEKENLTSADTVE